MESFDIAVVGGGPIGYSLALALSDLPLRVALLEKQAWDPAVKQSKQDARIYSLSPATKAILQGLGIWDRLLTSISPIQTIHISEKGCFGKTVLSAKYYNLPALGYILPAAQLMQTLQTQITQRFKGTLITGAELKTITPRTEGLWLHYDQEGSKKTVDCQLLVGADGNHSMVRQASGIKTDTLDYHQSALVTCVRTSVAHKFIAYERFLPQSIIALLPLKDQLCALIWAQNKMATEKQAHAPDTLFLRSLQEAFGSRLGRFEQGGLRQTYPLYRHLAQSLTAYRTVLIGHAAQALHPIAGQSFNLGLRDVAMLAEVITQTYQRLGKTGLGHTECLQTYAQARQADRLATIRLIDRLLQTYDSQCQLMRALRPLGLAAMHWVPGLQSALLKQSMGFGGNKVPLLASHF